VVISNIANIKKHAIPQIQNVKKGSEAFVRTITCIYCYTVTGIKEAKEKKI
jgi:hypothetical protein